MCPQTSKLTSRAQPIGLVTALKREIAPLLRHSKIVRRVETLSGRFFSARLGNRSVIVGWTGDGRREAGRSLRSLCNKQGLGGLIGLGVAGGLTPQIEVGQLIAAGEVRDHNGSAPRPDRRLLDKALTTRTVQEGLLFSSDRILSRAAEKEACWQALGQPTVATVDLETTTWARIAAENGIPFLAVRAVSDPASDDLPLDFESYRNAIGRVSSLRVALSALRHPSLIGPLRKLQRNVDLCAHHLSDWTLDFVLESPASPERSQSALSLEEAT